MKFCSSFTLPIDAASFFMPCRIFGLNVPSAVSCVIFLSHILGDMKHKLFSLPGQVDFENQHFDQSSIFKLSSIHSSVHPSIHHQSV
mmetsp:Transcript_1445/g.1725  ORF Transcript_1445/g.1725 Transcript_1445/m.1725 type:complete len:87 (+) Transcript_1445:481-741(+)